MMTRVTCFFLVLKKIKETPTLTGKQGTTGVPGKNSKVDGQLICGLEFLPGGL